MSLTGRVAALSHFSVARIDKYENAFQALEEHSRHSPFLSKPMEMEMLYLCLIVSKEAISAILVKEEGQVQWSVYYVSTRLLVAETRYPELEKLALALVVASRELRSYFHVNHIKVLTNHPLHQVYRSQKPQVGSLSGRSSWDNSMWISTLEQ